MVFHPVSGSGMTLNRSTQHLFLKKETEKNKNPRDISRNTSYQACSKWIMKVGRQEMPPYISFKNFPVGKLIQYIPSNFLGVSSHAHLSLYSWYSMTYCAVAFDWARKALHCMFLKPKIELIYVIYPVVHCCFHLEGPCIHRCYTHISSKHVKFFSSQIIIS